MYTKFTMVASTILIHVSSHPITWQQPFTFLFFQENNLINVNCFNKNNKTGAPVN